MSDEVICMSLYLIKISELNIYFTNKIIIY